MATEANKPDPTKPVAANASATGTTLKASDIINQMLADDLAEQQSMRVKTNVDYQPMSETDMTMASMEDSSPETFLLAAGLNWIIKAIKETRGAKHGWKYEWEGAKDAYKRVNPVTELVHTRIVPKGFTAETLTIQIDDINQLQGHTDAEIGLSLLVSAKSPTLFEDLRVSKRFWVSAGEPEDVGENGFRQIILILTTPLEAAAEEQQQQQKQ